MRDLAGCRGAGRAGTLIVMLLTNHVLAGAAIGATAPSASSAVIAGVLSHGAMDVFPHYRIPERRFFALAVCDGLTGLVVSAALLATCRPEHRWGVAAGIFGACLPDMDKPGRELFGRSPFPASVDRFHVRIQTEKPHLAAVEVAGAAVLGPLAWWLATRLPRRKK